MSRPTIHPDASRAVVAVSHPSLDADAYVGQLWNVPLDGSGPPRRITRGFNDSGPRFSPDGSVIGFIRGFGDGPGQLYVVDSAGGEPAQVTDAKLGIGAWRWSPDGHRIAFIARVPAEGRYGTVRELGPEAEPPRHIDTLKYQANGVGYTTDQRSQIFMVEVPDSAAEPVYRRAPSAEDPTPEAPRAVPEAVQLTSGDFDHAALAFSPDGSRLVFTSARHASRDTDLADDVFELRLDAGDTGDANEPIALTGRHRRYSISQLAYSSAGTLFFIAQNIGDGRDFVARNASLYAIEMVGEAARRLTDPESVDLGEVGSDLTVLDDGRVLVQDRTRGRVQLLAVSLDGSVERLTSGDLEVTGHDAAAGLIVVSFRDETTSGDLALVGASSQLMVMTNFSAELTVAGIAPLQELTVSARDDYPIHGWVILPRGEGPHPVLLNIHGGPFAQYSVGVFDEAQVYADAGYAVVMCNPRGSAGYGQAHGRAIRQKLGTVDFFDVIDFLDGALEANPSLDAERVGIMGGSYGGYLTAWTIAHDHRFVAAIVERGYLDPEYFIGTSDIGDFFSDEYAGKGIDLIRSQSPQAAAGQVSTPTLIIHSANDLRCPLSQAERYYSTLKRNGVAAELLIFPGENHELSRSGRPRHRIQRFNAILDWWARYLPVNASNTTAPSATDDVVAATDSTD